MPRFTISLPDDLYAMARSHAVAKRTSISKAIGDLLRRHSPPVPDASSVDPKKSSYFDPVLGIQVSRCAEPLTAEEVQAAIDDEDVRHLERFDRPAEQPPARQES